MEKLFILEIMLCLFFFFFLSYRLVAFPKLNVGFVASEDYFPLEKHDQILPKSSLVSSLCVGQVVAACYKDPVIKKLPSMLKFEKRETRQTGKTSIIKSN